MRALQRHLPGLCYHRWIKYLEEGERPRWAEPEGFLVRPHEVILVECKLTGGPYGRAQMEGFYAPLLAHIYERPVRCLLVVKNRTPDTPGPFVPMPEDFLRSTLSYGCWHYIGD